MPGPLAVAAYQGGAAVARYVAKHGVKKATEKYGKAALKKVASKKTAKSAATKAALVSGEGAAVRAVQKQRAKPKVKAKAKAKARPRKKVDLSDPFLNVAADSANKAIDRGVKGKMVNDARERRKRVTAAKKAAKNVKGPIKKRKAMYDAYKASGKKKRK